MKAGVVTLCSRFARTENYDGQLVSASVMGEFIDEGDHMGAFNTFLDQLEVKCAFLLAHASAPMRLSRP
ncbi:MAG: hypothetical protein AVDCRST_MAG93-2809 [uncultured Chloroflexia bacterium]|uniref:Uncharacterized protein n=1 Tax=uncultured Chloroflexia bacterium TaxID=1672391 RepID=A0A6J4J9W7_9CHLR|nr:MAG: hypothetical protein AVDCRST_MAG93-2809 [uncultured Chloroflexia bacterium]